MHDQSHLYSITCDILTYSSVVCQRVVIKFTIFDKKFLLFEKIEKVRKREILLNKKRNQVIEITRLIC